MTLVLFHLTLLVLLVSILAAATCLSAYLVSRKRLMLFSFVGFLFYFFDVSLVFQDEFVATTMDAGLGSVYLVVRSIASLVTGGGFLMALWLLVCDYLDEKRRVVLVMPLVVFLLGSVAMLVLMPDGDNQRFWFYSMRAFFLFWMLLFTLGRYFASKDEVERTRLWRHRLMWGVVLALGLLVVFEDALFFLILDEPVVWVGPIKFSAERNYAEELVMLSFAFAACRDAVRILSLRFERPPVNGGRHQEEQISDNLMMYAKRHKLSAREREVLHLILLGKDNQNIASSMQLALSTVKVHVHNILQKTGQHNRQALIQDFWKMS